MGRRTIHQPVQLPQYLHRLRVSAHFRHHANLRGASRRLEHMNELITNTAAVLTALNPLIGLTLAFIRLRRHRRRVRARSDK